MDLALPGLIACDPALPDASPDLGDVAKPLTVDLGDMLLKPEAAAAPLLGKGKAPGGMMEDDGEMW